MKFKPTPLFLVSLGLIICGLYIFSVAKDLGGLMGILVGGAGIFGMVIYVLLRVILTKEVWIQVGVETFLILGSLYFHYKLSGAYQFHLPLAYRGYVILVYGVEHAATLKTPFYSNKVKLEVPSSGIILTSSLRKDNYSDLAIFVDIWLEEIHLLQPPFERHALFLSSDTLKCPDKNYLFDLWIIKDEPNWSIEEDNIARPVDKFVDACNLIK